MTWTCYVEDGLHYAEMKIKGPKFQYNAKAHADNLYKTLDKVVAKIETQVKKKKSKWKDHIHHKHDEVYKGSTDIEDGYGEDYVDDMFKKIA